MISGPELLSALTQAFENHAYVAVTTRGGTRFTGFVADRPSDRSSNTCVLTDTSDYSHVTRRVVLSLSEVVAVETWTRS